MTASGGIRCAIAGPGRIGSQLESDRLREKPCTHAGAIAADSDCILVGGCDIDGEARERFLEDWSPGTGNSLEVYADVHRMIDQAAPEILVVATYPESHRRLTEGAVRAGVPVVICEKPLARTLRDARAITRIHSSGRARVLVNHERRYSRDYIEARRAVTDRDYGKLLSIRGTLCFGSSHPRREVLLHDGTHMLDAVNFLTGTTVRLRRRFGSMRGTKSSAFLYGRAGRVPVVLEIGSERDHLVFELELGFEHGRIRVGNGVYSFEKSGESPYYEGYRSLAPDPGAAPRPEKTNYFSGMIADAVRCVREPGYRPLSSAPDALEVMKFIKSVKTW